MPTVLGGDGLAALGPARRAATFMNADRLAVLPIRVLGAWECSFACVEFAASACADALTAARSHPLRVTAGPRPPTRTEGIADVIVLSRRRRHER